MFDFLKGKNLLWVLFISINFSILHNIIILGNNPANKQWILIVPLFLVSLFLLNRMKPFNEFLNELMGRGKVDYVDFKDLEGKMEEEKDDRKYAESTVKTKIKHWLYLIFGKKEKEN